jgi:hypothetical protein
MAKKRASLEEKGEEILGMKRGGQGADILFGTESPAEPGAETEDEGTPSAEEGVPGGEADLDEAVSAEAEAEEKEETAAEPAESTAFGEEGMPQGEADLDEELDLDSLLSAEAEAAEEEAGLPELATMPAAPTPPPSELSTLPPTMDRPLPIPPSRTPPAGEPSGPPPQDVEQPMPASAAATAMPAPPPTIGRPFSAPPPPSPAAPPGVPPSPAPAIAPPSTASGAPDLSVRRPPRYIQMVSGDFDLLAEELSAEAAAAALIGAPEAVELTEEQRDQLLRRRSVIQELAELDKAIDGEYERILRDNVSVNQSITDWCHNLLAEARNIVLHRQVDNLAKAEWNVQQVRARLDRAEESRKQANRYAWPIIIWGAAWFLVFVYLIFNIDEVFQPFLAQEGINSFLQPQIFLRALFFGGIGGVAAVFFYVPKYVQERSFDSQHTLSYVTKPFMGMIVGSMIYLTLFVLMRVLGILPAGLAEGSIETLTDLMYVALLYFLALAAGFKENLAFDLLSRVIKAALRSDKEEEKPSAPAPTTTETGS